MIDGAFEKIIASRGTRATMGSLGSIIERITVNPPKAKHFRQHVAIEHVSPYIQGKHVVEIGCGSGRASRHLIERVAAPYIGIDLSQNAIDLARAKTEEAGLSDKVTYRRSGVIDLDTTQADFVISIGFMHWLTWEEVEHVFNSTNGNNFFHTITQSEYSFRQLLRHLYIKYSETTDTFSNYRKLDDICAVAHKHGWGNLYSFEHKDLYSIVGLSSLPLPNTLGPQYIRTMASDTNSDKKKIALFRR
jgi:2-polyprenyl-3-methyl-5-hydroxy-6-metoxy-1,4-benzoquinol methylase